MTKEEEIEHRIKKYELVRECAEENLNELNIQLRDLCESEKPKLRHGDFGYWIGPSDEESDSDEFIHLLSKGKLRPADKNEFYFEQTTTEEYYSVLGNIFDLLEEWSGPFARYERKCLGGNTLIISQSSWVSDGIEFRINKGGNYATASIPEAEEIWHKLGHAIAELKRKENKCS